MVCLPDGRLQRRRALALVHNMPGKRRSGQKIVPLEPVDGAEPAYVVFGKVNEELAPLIQAPYLQGKAL